MDVGTRNLGKMLVSISIPRNYMNTPPNKHSAFIHHTSPIRVMNKAAFDECLICKPQQRLVGADVATYSRKISILSEDKTQRRTDKETSQLRQNIGPPLARLSTCPPRPDGLLRTTGSLSLLKSSALGPCPSFVRLACFSNSRPSLSKSSSLISSFVIPSLRHLPNSDAQLVVVQDSGPLVLRPW